MATTINNRANVAQHLRLVKYYKYYKCTFLETCETRRSEHEENPSKDLSVLQKGVFVILYTHLILCYNVAIMVITYQGLESFKLQFGDLTLVTNPASKDSAFKTSKFGANIVLQTINHPDTNGGADFTYGDKSPFIVTSPGEYETGGIFIKGFPETSSHDGKSLINTVYTFQLDGINICFLGALDKTTLNPETLEGIDSVDILFVPIGGNGVLSASEAYKLAVKLEAKIVIPMHYDEKGGSDKDALKTFLKEAGESVSPVDKLTIKKKDLEGKEGEVMVLSVV